MNQKICLFIGSHRPVVGKHDSGEDLLRALLYHNLNVSTVYLRPDDPLRKKRYRNCEICSIPAIMRQPRKLILQNMKEKKFQDDWNSWLKDFYQEEYSLGIVYFGSWLPPELFQAPKFGFINFHPGPLPTLRGFEAETWAILTDMRYFFGTVHRVNAEYDEGEIIWHTRQIRIRRHETPASLLQRTCYAGINKIYQIVRKVHSGEVQTYPQKITDGILASVKLISSHAKIDWSTDSLSILNRKNRAFNGQYISVPLVLEYEGSERIVRNIYLIPSKQSGGLGEYLGQYQSSKSSLAGKYMFQALDGIAVLDILPKGARKPDRASVFATYKDNLFS